MQKCNMEQVGAEAGVTLFDGAGKHPGLNVVLAQPSCAYSAEYSAFPINR